MRPILVMNPADDTVFAAFARILVDHGASDIGQLEGRLRTVFPDAVVHKRELTSEPSVIWYVYRDGHWVRSGRAAVPTSGAKEEHAKSTRRLAGDRRVDPTRRRAVDRHRGGEGRP